jgi:hypothetical protein
MLYAMHGHRNVWIIYNNFPLHKPPVGTCLYCNYTPPVGSDAEVAKGV